MHGQPRVSLQSRAAFCWQKCICIMFRWTFISILATREECAAGSAKTILVEVMAETGETKAVRFIWSTVVEMRLQIYLVESCTRPLMSVLCSVFPLCILYAFWLSGTCSFVVCHSFGDIWLVELKPCVTYSLPVRFNRSMSGTCTSVVPVFLPDWPFCHRITKILIRFTFGGSIRSSVTGALNLVHNIPK